MQMPNEQWNQQYGQFGGGGSGMNWGGQLADQLGGGKWGDLGNILGGSKLGGMFGKLAGGIGGKLAKSGIGQAVGGFLGGGTGQALMKGLGTNPFGLALMAGSKLLSAFGGAKKAKSESKRITGKIGEVGEAMDEAEEYKDEQAGVYKGEHLTGVKTSGRQAGRGKEQVDVSSEQAYQGAGFQESGQIDYAAEVSTKQIDEDFGTKKESLDKILGQSLAENQTQFNQFQDQANETIAGLEAARGKLKTKWYQNLV